MCMHTRKGHRQSPSIHQTWPDRRNDRAVASCNANRRSVRQTNTDRVLNLPRKWAISRQNGLLKCRITELIKVTYCTIRLRLIHLGNLHSIKREKWRTIGFIRLPEDGSSFFQVAYLITLPVLRNAVRLVKNVLSTSELVCTALWRRTRLVLVFAWITIFLVVWLMKCAH